MDECLLRLKSLFTNINDTDAERKSRQWLVFLEKNNFKTEAIEKIEMSGTSPVIFDKSGNKISIDFINNKLNYHKKKSSIKIELISRAMGGGKYGLNILDLSAGLGIDSVFLAQLGYKVTALERNPLIYLALNDALIQKPELSLKFVYGDALDYLKILQINVDLIYFDPMFPEKSKSALPRQEMVLFKKLVGHDEDATEVLGAALDCPTVKRVAVKRPIKAPSLLKPMSSIKGKLIRFDLYKGACK